MSHPFDAAGKDLLESDPVAVAAMLGIMRPPGRIVLIDSDVSTITAAADKVIRIEDTKPWLLHVEIQSSRDPSIPSRMLQYNSLLHLRHKFPVDSVLILLVPRADLDDLTGRYQSSGPLGPAWQFRYSVLRIWKLDVEALLRGPPAMLTLAPIAKVSERDVPRILRGVVERLKHEPPDEANRLFTALGVFLQLRYQAMTAEELIEMMPEAKELPVFKKWIEEGIAKGRSQGLVIGTRNTILKMGKKKFGRLSRKVEAALNTIDNQAQLEALSERLLAVNSWEELLRPQ